MLKKFLFNLNRLANESIGIDIRALDKNSLEKYAVDKSPVPWDVEYFAEKIKNLVNIEFDDSNDFWLYISGLEIYWVRIAREGKGSLAGGFYINGASMIFLTEQQEFWKDSEMLFDRFENKEEMLDDPRALSWIECTTAVRNALATESYGCTRIKDSADLDEFYFYDSGKLYDLPFQSAEAYFDALFSSAAVECWQYFFVDPQVIIEKNKGLPYITWNLHYRSELRDDMYLFKYNPAIPYDRLDLINEYLERCVLLLPKSFPFLDFSHHIAYYENFQQLYEASKD